MKKALMVVLSLPLLWLAWQVYDQSVRWGTSDPCEMITERLEPDSVLDPLDRYSDHASVDQGGGQRMHVWLMIAHHMTGEVRRLPAGVSCT